MTVRMAVYGKGGIGKSTVSANISASLARKGGRVLQIGCDPKHDSTRTLLGGSDGATVLDYLRDVRPQDRRLDDIVHAGSFGIDCVEAGGPQPGVGCAGRGILSTFDTLAELGLRSGDYDYVVYDVLGDVVCGGFAVPLRREHADIVLIVTSGEFMSLYAANNILRGVRSFDGASSRLGGIVLNQRGLEGEVETVMKFSRAVRLPVLASLPRSQVFASAEALGRTVVEAFPGSEEASLLGGLASKISGLADGSLPLHAPRPLEDFELEEAVLGRKRKVATVQAGDVGTVAMPPPPPPRPRGAVDLSRAVHGCAFNGAVSVTSQFRDGVTIVHGPDGCAALASHFSTLREGRYADMAHRVVPIGMDDRMMVFGGSEELERAVSSALSGGARIAFVVTACPSGLMGEDADAVARRAEERFPGRRAVAIRSDGNITGDFSQGLVQGYRAAASLIDPDVEAEPMSVTLVGEKNMATNRDRNFLATKGLLDQLGVGIACRFVSDTSLDEVASLRKGAVAIRASDEFAVGAAMPFLKEKGLEEFPLAVPRGFSQTAEWLEALGRRFDAERRASETVGRIRAEYGKAISEASVGLKGKRAIVAAMDDSVGWVAELANDLGMEVLKSGVPPQPYPGLGRRRGTVVGYSREDLARDVEDLNPDIVIAHPMYRASEHAARHAYLPYSPDVGPMAGIEAARSWSVLMKVPGIEGWRRDGRAMANYLPTLCQEGRG